MDHCNNKLPVLIHSFDLNEEPPVPADCAKKRKLPDEHLVLPLSKYKFRDRSCGSDNESSVEDNVEEGKHVPFWIQNEWTTSKMNDELEDSAESFKGSYNYSGGSGSAMTVDIGIDTTSPRQSFARKPSTSSGSYSRDTSNSLYSLDSRVTANAGAAKQETLTDEMEDDIQLEEEVGYYKEQLLEFHAYSRLMNSVEGTEIEQCMNSGVEDLILYSNGVLSDASIPASRKGVSRIITSQSRKSEFLHLNRSQTRYPEANNRSRVRTVLLFTDALESLKDRSMQMESFLVEVA